MMRSAIIKIVTISGMPYLSVQVLDEAASRCNKIPYHGCQLICALILTRTAAIGLAGE